MHFTHSHESHWEIVDQRSVPPVPMFYDESDVQISSVLTHDVSHTYTFDGPSTSSLCPSSPKNTSKLLKPPSSPKFGFKMSRSPSPSLSDPESLDSESSMSSSAYSSSSSSSGYYHDRRDFSASQARDALVSARCQLMNSAEFRKLGVNILFQEGWSITKLRKGSKYRLEVRYTARPAKATLRSGASKASLARQPPFMDMLEDGWY